MQYNLKEVAAINRICADIKGQGTTPIKDMGEYLKMNDCDARIERYQSTLDPNDPFQIKGFLIGIEKLNAIIQATNCDGIRIYFAKKPASVGNYNVDLPELILVPVDANGKDIKTPKLDAVADEYNILGEPRPCPNLC